MNCKTCKNPFEPIIGFNGLVKSRNCKECDYQAERSKRIAKMAQSKVVDIKEGKKALKSRLTVDRKIRVTEKSDNPKLRNVDYSQKTVSKLLGILEEHFNLFIRNRDRLPGNTFFCPTCQTYKVIDGDNYQACHCFPSTYSALRFHELNVWGGCKSCNYWKHGAGHEYTDWLKNKIGETEYNKLLILKNQKVKWDKFYLIEMIKKYRMLNLQEVNNF